MKPEHIFKALSDETRLFLCLLISKEKELCVCELVAALNLSQPKISRHLAYLRSFGILQDERRGQWVYYSLSSALPAWLSALLNTLCSENFSKFSSYQGNLKNMKNRPKCC